MHARRIEACAARGQARRARSLRRLAGWLAAGLVGSGCAALLPARDLASSAVAARGGPLPRFARSSELAVYQGYPGTWKWELAFDAPERLSVTLETAAESQTLESDGAFVRSYVGGALVSEEPARGSGVAALVTFVALANLDALLDGERVAWQVLPAGELPAGAARGLRASVRAAPEAQLTLGFDDALRLVSLAGPVSIPGLGDGPLEARFEDFRRVQRRWLPFAIHYRFRGAPLLDERVREWRIGSEAGPAGFQSPRPGPHAYLRGLRHERFYNRG